MSLPLHFCSSDNTFSIFKGIFKALKQKAKGTNSTEGTTNDVETESSTASLSSQQRNPFLQENEGQTYSKLDVAMDALTAFTVKRNLSEFSDKLKNYKMFFLY